MEKLQRHDMMRIISTCYFLHNSETFDSNIKIGQVVDLLRKKISDIWKPEKFQALFFLIVLLKYDWFKKKIKLKLSSIFGNPLSTILDNLPSSK